MYNILEYGSHHLTIPAIAEVSLVALILNSQKGHQAASPLDILVSGSFPACLPMRTLPWTTSEAAFYEIRPWSMSRSLEASRILHLRTHIKSYDFDGKRAVMDDFKATAMVLAIITSPSPGAMRTWRFEGMGSVTVPALLQHR